MKKKLKPQMKLKVLMQILMFFKSYSFMQLTEI